MPDTRETLVVLAALLAGSIVQGAVGFGIGIFAVGILSLFMPVRDVSLIILGLTVIMSSSVLARYHSHIRWQVLVPNLIGTLPGRLASYFFLHSYGDMDVAKQVLGVTLLAVVGFLYIRQRGPAVPEQFLRTHIATGVVGTVGGFVGGAFAVGGPIYALYFLNRFADKREYNANLQVTFMAANLFTLTAHAAGGDLSVRFVYYLVTGSLVVFLGLRYGIRWFERVPRPIIVRCAYGVVVATAIRILAFP